MSELTKTKLADAQRAVLDARFRALGYKQKLVTTVSGRIPERLDQYARKVALAQPDNALAMGAQRLQTLRTALRVIADDIVAELSKAAASDEWLDGAPYATFDDNKIYLALYSVVDPFLQKITQTIEDHGLYSPAPPRPTTQPANRDERKREFADVKPVNGGDLIVKFEGQLLHSLSEALHALGKAKRAVQTAEQEHKQAEVSELWGSSFGITGQ